MASILLDMLFSWWTISRICPFSSPRVMDMDGLSGCAGHKSDLADSLCFIIRDPVIHYSTPPPRLVCCCVRHDCILGRSEEHTSELQSLMRISYAFFCLKKN